MFDSLHPLAMDDIPTIYGLACIFTSKTGDIHYIFLMWMIRLFFIYVLCLSGSHAASGFPEEPSWQIWVQPDPLAGLDSLQKIPDTAWKKTNHHIINMGFISGAVWLKTQIKPSQSGRYILELANLPKDYVSLFVVTAQKNIAEQHIGTALARNGSAPLYHNAIFTMDLTANENITLFLRVSSSDAVILRPLLYSSANFEETARHSRLLLGINIGIYIALGLYTLLVWAATHDKDFEVTFLFMSSLGLLQINLTGVLYEYLLFSHPQIMEFSRTLFPTVAFFYFIKFSCHFLNLAYYSPRINRYFDICRWVVIALPFIYFILGPTWANKLNLMTGLILIGLGSIAGLIAWSRGFRPARFYLLAQLTIFIGGGLFVMTTFGAIPVSEVGMSGLQWGSVMAAILNGISLADKINIIQIEKLKAQHQLLITEKNAKELLRQSEIKLEERIKERTSLLENALQLQQEQSVSLLQANRQLESLNEEKNAYLGIAAHDLKNPITAIIGYVDLLHERWQSWDNDKKLLKINNIGNLARHIHNIIRKLLDINAIESGYFKLNPTNQSLLTTCSTIVGQFHEQTEKKDIVLHIECPETLLVYVDSGVLMQILDNLVSNAIKYSPPGRGIWIKAWQEEQTVILQVRDEGPGLSADDQKKLFRKFTRLSAQPTGGEHSTGLGLYIVKKLVDASNAHIFCDSRLGEGTSFIVHLPVSPCLQPPNSATEDQPADNPQK